MATPVKAIELSKNLSKFSTDLYQKCADSSDGNIIISPYSIACAVGLLSQGARGTTFDEIASALRFPSDKIAIADLFHELSGNFAKSNASITLNVANQVYVQRGYQIKSEFNEIATKKFESGVEAVNFAENVASANHINGWVEKKTNSKITDLIKPDSLGVDTRVVLVNAIYFKGDWKNKFDKELTAPGPFYVNDKDTVNVEYMHTKKHFKFGYLDELDATAIELPYVDSDISFVVVLPNSREGLSVLEAKIKEYDLTKIAEQMYSQEVQVTLPKFKIEHEVNLNDVLKKLGMVEMFSNSADLSDLLESPEPLKVSEVVHKAFIEINEEGSEAAAATGVLVMCRSMPICQQFTADHPFLYYISKANAVLFNGRYKN